MESRFFKQPIWIVPLVIAGLVALIGWWGNTRVRETIEEQLKTQLVSTLDANVTALEIWITNQTRLAMSLAEEPQVRALSARVLEHSSQPGTERRFVDLSETEELNNYLGSRLQRMGYGTAQLVNTNFMIAANLGVGRGRLLRNVPVAEAHVARFSDLFESGMPVMITPFKPELPPVRRLFSRNRGQRPRDADSESQPRPGSGEVQRRRGDITLMQVAAPLRSESGTIGALALVINPDEEFSRILSVARSGESGETYAFDQTGLLISRSRFDDQLRQLGLLGETNASSALNLRLHDPGADLTAGFQPEVSDGVRPLIRIAAEAVARESGVDVVPSRDYRGVPVVGAWRWLPQLGVGVATQIDATEAFRPLRVLKLIFISLFLLLVLCAIGMFLFSYLNLTWQRRLSEAELKLKQLGQYTLEEKIGEGGMGVVYRARHALMRRDTAVKLLLPDRADPESIQRFEREVCLTCRLTHPNTIQVYDYGHTPEGIFYYAMEFLRGLNLHQLVAGLGVQPEARVVHVLTQICESLAEAHALGLVHRDVKPANVFLCDRGGVSDCIKVLDFGLIREYKSGNGEAIKPGKEEGFVGTPWFMAPEAIRNSARSDPRSDIYSVGALGYYLLTGKYIFEAEKVQDIYNKQLAGRPAPPRERTANLISLELQQIVLQCLESDPAARPQSAAELRAFLLATPRAMDWTPDARAAWWNKYGERILHPTDPATTSSPAPTVRIDFASRVQR